jgi:hypothetical protein
MTPGMMPGMMPGMTPGMMPGMQSMAGMPEMSGSAGMGGSTGIPGLQGMGEVGMPKSLGIEGNNNSINNMTGGSKRSKGSEKAYDNNSKVRNPFFF